MDTQINTEVSKRGPAHFDMCGKFLHYPLVECEGSISAGLVKRLYAYATKRAKECGLFSLLQGWQVTIYTMAGDDDDPANRGYNVAWDNPQGTRIELCEILTRSGWPFLDHRFSIS